MSQTDTTVAGTETELKRLMDAFFAAVSFASGSRPDYERIRELFIGQGLLIKNSEQTPEISTIDEFIAPRQRVVAAGELTSF